MITPKKKIDKKSKIVKKTEDAKLTTKRLLKEVFSFEPSAKMLQEGLESHSISTDDSEPLILRGIIQRCNTLNQNGRVYPRNILVPKIEQYIKNKVNTGTAYGGLDHKDSEIVEWSDVAFRFIKIWFEDDVVLGEIVVIPGTDADKILRGALKTGGKVGISSRAMGSVQRQTLPEGIVADVVQDDLGIICWDIVTEPSTTKAFMEESTGEEVENPKMVVKAPKLNPASLSHRSISMNESKNVLRDETSYSDLLTMAKKLKGN
jgi:hypothetical protein